MLQVSAKLLVPVVQVAGYTARDVAAQEHCHDGDFPGNVAFSVGQAGARCEECGGYHDCADLDVVLIGFLWIFEAVGVELECTYRHHDKPYKRHVGCCAVQLVCQAAADEVH
jgi:hypothetical protein